MLAAVGPLTQSIETALFSESGLAVMQKDQPSSTPGCVPSGPTASAVVRRYRRQRTIFLLQVNDHFQTGNLAGFVNLLHVSNLGFGLSRRRRGA